MWLSDICCLLSNACKNSPVSPTGQLTCKKFNQPFFKKVMHSREMMMKTQKRKKLAILHQVCPGQIQKMVDEQTLQESYNSRWGSIEVSTMGSNEASRCKPHTDRMSTVLPHIV